MQKMENGVPHEPHLLEQETDGFLELSVTGFPEASATLVRCVGRCASSLETRPLVLVTLTKAKKNAANV